MLSLKLVTIEMAIRRVVLSLILYLFAVVSADNSLNALLFNGNYEFIDLTHPFDNSTVYWPGGEKFRFTKKLAGIRDDGSWYSTNTFEANEHGGTHIDAPYHFYMTGRQVGDIPLDKLIVPLIIVDISSKVNDDPNFVLFKEHLDYLLNDNMGKPCVIVFKFGWSKYFKDPKYLGWDEYTKTLKFPGLSSELATWITSSYKNVVGIGVDVASVDSGASINFPVHNIIAKAGLYGIENVDLSRPVPEYGCTALVLPMKIAEGTGAPLRMVAICPKPTIPNTF